MKSDQKQKILDFIKKAEDGQLVGSMALCVDYLMKEGLAYKQVLRSQAIGVHEENRDGVMIDVAHVSELIATFERMGWRDEEAKAMCIELADDEASERTREANRQLCSASDGQLAPADGFKEKMRFASIQGSHTNQAFRSILFGCNQRDARAMPQEMQAALDKGLQWTVISRACVSEFPKLVGLLQACGNALQQVAKSEDELQMALKISNILKRSGTKTVRWGDIQSEVLRSKPPCSLSCPWIFAFVLKYGGAFLEETEMYVRSHGRQSKQLGPEVWEAMQTQMRGSDQRVVWRHMFLKFAYCCADKQFSIGDAKKAIANKSVLQSATAAEKGVSEFKDLLGSHPERLKILGSLQVQLVAVVLEKKKMREYEGVGECLHGVAVDAGLTPLACWKPASSAGATASATPKAKAAGKKGEMMPAREYNDAGKLTNVSAILTGMGFKVDAMGSRKDEVVAKIVAFQDSDVLLELDETLEKKLVSSASFIEGQWKLYTPPKAQEEIAWLTEAPLTSKEMQMSMIKARVIHAMWEQLNQKKHDLESFLVLKSPKAIRSTKTWAQSKLLLPCASPKVVLRAHGTGNINDLVIGKWDIYDVCIPMSTKMLKETSLHEGFMNPFHMVPRVVEEEEANLEAQARRANVCMTSQSD
ncbi:unnamed protein product [Durusdinium trenchii]|uniref:Uncharacterized protein n=1 Tax=Durusdinium trenchii TaxID=1381693 RepID=A0ABP0JVH7_9DINO